MTSFLTIYNFLEESSEDIFQIEQAYVQESKNIISGEIIHKSPDFDCGLKFMDDQLRNFDSVSARVPEMEQFFTKIMLNQKFASMYDLTVSVYPTTEISTFKLGYLKEFTSKTFKVLEGALNGKKSYNDDLAIEKLKLLKKNMVVQKVPTYVKDKDFLKMDNAQTVKVNPPYLDRVLLPYLRGFSHEYELLMQTAAKIREVLTECTVSFRSYDDTIVRLMNEPETAANKAVVYKELSYAKYIFLNASKYVIACFLRKVHTIIANLSAYSKLKGTLQRILPEVDPFMESVESDDFDGSSLLNGNVGQILDVIDRVIVANGSNADLEAIKSSEFDYKPFHCMTKTLQAFHKSYLETAERIEDFELSFDEVTNTSWVTTLREKATKAYALVTSPAIYYDLSYPIKKAAILKELAFAKKYWSELAIKLRDLKEEVVRTQTEKLTSADDLDTPVTRNKEISDYLNLFIDTMESTFLGFMKAYYERMNRLDIMLQKGMPEGPGVMIDTESFLESTLVANLEIQKSLHESAIDDLFLSIEKEIYDKKTLSDPITLLMEADESNGEKKDTQPKVTDNANQQPENGDPKAQDTNQQQNTNTNNNTATNNESNGKSTEEKKKTLQDRIDKIKEAIKNFIRNIQSSLAKTAKNNLKFIELNEKMLLERSYNNVSVEMVDYNTSIGYVKLINDLASALRDSGLQDRVTNGSLTSANVRQELLKNLNLKGGNNDKLTDRISLTLKTNGSEKEVGTKTYANGELKAKIQPMLEYCKYYYGNFGNEITNASNSCISAITELENKIRSNQNIPDGMEATINEMLSVASTMNSVVGDVARSRAQDYMKVFDSLRLKKKENTKSESTENTNAENTDGNTEGNQENTPKDTQPKE